MNTPSIYSKAKVLATFFGKNSQFISLAEFQNVMKDTFFLENCNLLQAYLTEEGQISKAKFEKLLGYFFPIGKERTTDTKYVEASGNFILFSQVKFI